MKQEYILTIKYTEGSDRIMVSGNGAGSWMDLGIILEGLGMMIAQVDREKTSGKTHNELIQYCKDYIDKSGNDYNKNWSAKVPKLE